MLGRGRPLTRRPGPLSLTLGRLACLTLRLGLFLLRTVFRLAPAPPPSPQELVHIVVLPHSEEPALRRARGRHVLDRRVGGADNGDGGVGNGEVLVLLERVGESGQAVVDELGEGSCSCLILGHDVR
jgi:hypothetical protein